MPPARDHDVFRPAPPSSVTTEACFLNFYGVTVAVSADPAFLRDVRHDFSYFASSSDDGGPDTMRIVVNGDRERPAGWRPFRRTRRATLFRSVGTEQRVLFFDRAWVRYDVPNRHCHIHCDDADVAYEVCYLVLLAYSGERLDERKLHRVHGLGLAFGEEGMVVLAPSGGGKSTLAFEAIQNGPDLLSDDTPLVSHDGRLHAFPLRIALFEPPPAPAEYVRRFRRVEYREKYVVSAEYFKHRVRPSVPARWLVILRQGRSKKPRFTKAGRWRAVWPLAKWLVAGYETQQVWEISVRFTLRDILAKLAIAFGRLKAAVALLRRCDVLFFDVSTDVHASAEALRAFRRD